MTMTPDELATQKMLTSLASDVSALKALTEQLLKAIHGNGQPGLIERVAKLETKVAVVAGLAGIFASAIAEVVKSLF